jgi:hypothetical protein
LESVIAIFKLAPILSHITSNLGSGGSKLSLAIPKMVTLKKKKIPGAQDLLID